MWAAWAVAAIALAATAFMLRFLIALLSENAPSVCYWLAPVRREPEKEPDFKVLHGIYFDDDCRATASDHGDYRLELMENEHHAKEKCTSGLITLSVRPVPDNVVWRSDQPSRSNVSRRSWL
jgi:hypothetical protein